MLNLCLTTQLCVNKKYSRVLSTHPCGVPVFKMSDEEVCLPTLTTWGLFVRKDGWSQTKVSASFNDLKVRDMSLGPKGHQFNSLGGQENVWFERVNEQRFPSFCIHS